MRSRQQVVLLIRPGRRATPQQRAAKEILKNDCFDRLRAEFGDRFEEEMASRVSAVAGDVGTDGLGLDDDGTEALSQCDIVVHSAATVSFDSPLDTAVEVNLLGPSRVAAAVHPSQRAARRTKDEPVRSTSSRSRPPMWRAPTRARRKRSCWTTTGSPSTSIGRPKWRPPGASAATSMPSRGGPTD